jgi:hypothetical protein
VGGWGSACTAVGYLQSSPQTLQGGGVRWGVSVAALVAPAHTDIHSGGALVVVAVQLPLLETALSSRAAPPLASGEALVCGHACMVTAVALSQEWSAEVLTRGGGPSEPQPRIYTCLLVWHLVASRSCQIPLGSYILKE